MLRFQSLQFLRTYTTLSPLKLSALTLLPAASPKPLPPNKSLIFGHTFTDHMLTIEWSSDKGWEKPVIKPYGKLELDPSCTVFHYGTECFEGMKAYFDRVTNRYKDKNGKIRLFRPDMNMDRSCVRLMLPGFDKTELLGLIKAFVKLDSRWIPSEKGYSLYIRPTAIATQPSLGVAAPNKSMIFVIASPVGPYYKTGFSAVSLYASSKYVRAWPGRSLSLMLGGTGDAKIGGNYAPGIFPQVEVAEKGFQQVLWLFGPELCITEVGTMNFFMLWKNKGVIELVTPPLDGTILPGVTRDSIIKLVRKWGEIPVREGVITMKSVIEASKEGRILEMFGAGTAAIVSPIKRIKFEEVDIYVPLDPNDKSQQAGPLTRKLASEIMAIQYGDKESEWSVEIN